MGQAIKDAVDAVSFDAPDAGAGESGEDYRARLITLQDGNREKALDALGEALVDYITGNLTIVAMAPPGMAGGPLIPVGGEYVS